MSEPRDPDWPGVGDWVFSNIYPRKGYHWLVEWNEGEQPTPKRVREYRRYCTEMFGESGNTWGDRWIVEEDGYVGFKNDGDKAIFLLRFV